MGQDLAIQPADVALFVLDAFCQQACRKLIQQPANFVGLPPQPPQRLVHLRIESFAEHGEQRAPNAAARKPFVDIACVAAKICADFGKILDDLIAFDSKQRSHEHGPLFKASAARYAA